MIKRKFNKKHKGQGVIEYAGALVVAAALVAAVLTVGPNSISDLFTNIMNTVTTYLEGQLNSHTGGGGGS